MYGMGDDIAYLREEIRNLKELVKQQNATLANCHSYIRSKLIDDKEFCNETILLNNISLLMYAYNKTTKEN